MLEITIVGTQFKEEEARSLNKKEMLLEGGRVFLDPSPRATTG